MALGTPHHPQIVGEQKGGVRGATTRLRVKLHRQPRLDRVRYALVGAVIGVRVQWSPTVGQRCLVDSEAMVLGRDVAPPCAKVYTRLVDAAVAELHLVGLGTCGERKQLVAEANAEDGRRRPRVHHFADVIDRNLAVLRVSGPIADEETVELLRSEVVIPRHDLQSHAQVVDEETDDVVLHATIHGHHQGGRAFAFGNLGLEQTRALQ
mmetsp:Transcript_39184/g.118393  ORF Transcript_39184/g.118393 Transcript_39184/m.118393 type:complete len:208 (-) Transcript_39184:672-1295(-)